MSCLRLTRQGWYDEAPHVKMLKSGEVVLSLFAAINTQLSVIPFKCNDDRLSYVINSVQCVSGYPSVGSPPSVLPKVAAPLSKQHSIQMDLKAFLPSECWNSEEFAPERRIN
jgi:hypothetical protein